MVEIKRLRVTSRTLLHPSKLHTVYFQTYLCSYLPYYIESLTRTLIDDKIEDHKKTKMTLSTVTSQLAKVPGIRASVTLVLIKRKSFMVNGNQLYRRTY